MIGSTPKEFYKPNPMKRAQQRKDGIAMLIACVLMVLWFASIWLNSGPSK